MGVADNFKVFCSNLIVSNASSISTRYKEITKRLNKDFRNLNSETYYSFYSGSYGRNTAINGISDLDVIYQLPYEIYEKYNNYRINGQSALLQAVRESIKKRYSITNISADGQIVQVPFNDGITFEIVPAFINKNCSYTYPDANNGGKWRITNPKPEIEAIRKMNADCNGNLIPLCRMMRAWKQKWDVPIKGLLIDTLAYNFIKNWQFKDKSYLYYDFISRDFFEYMKNQSRTQEYWKSPGSNQHVYGKDLFQYKAGRCYNIALQAIEYTSGGYIATSKQKWREIYGTNFPN